MIGRDLLTDDERAAIRKVAPTTYMMAEGTVTMDEAVDLWIPWLGKMLTFRVSNGDARTANDEALQSRYINEFKSTCSNEIAAAPMYNEI